MDSVLSLRFQVACLRSSMNVILDALDARSMESGPDEFIEKELPLAVEDALTALATLEDLVAQLDRQLSRAHRT